MQRITSSVGHNGRNNNADVKVIQQLLNRQRIPGHTAPLKPDGFIGPRTIARIEAFQRAILKMSRPDGRVDPNGKTLAALNRTPTPGAVATTATVTYASGLASSKQIVSPYAISVIQLALQDAGMTHAVITSTIRTPDEQARIMYRNAKKDLSKQFNLYGSTGDQVLKVYANNKTRPEAEVIRLMKEKIEALLTQGRRTSKHVVTENQYKTLNIIDIGVNSTRAVSGPNFNIQQFTQALSALQQKGYIDKLIDETKKTNSCWHVEISPNKKPLP